MRKVYIAITAWIIIVAIVVVVLRRLPHTIPFETVSGIEFWNAGTGNWQSNVNIMSDGTFTAQGHDLDMGINGEGYPGGTMWMMDGGGSLSDLKKINNYTYKATVKSTYSNIHKTEYDGESGGGWRYVYGDISLKEGDVIYIYPPGTLTREIPEDYFDLVSVKLGHKWKYEHQQTDFYAMYIVADDHHMGFVGYK